MPIRHAIWKVAPQPVPLTESSLVTEQLLEEMIIAAPRLLSDEWMLIGQQESTGFGGRVDLLAIAPDGAIVLIELKRHRTPREVVAQALDYASWIQTLEAEDIVNIYGRFAPGRSLAADFRQRFGQDLDDDSLNQNHQIDDSCSLARRKQRKNCQLPQRTRHCDQRAVFSSVHEWG